MGTAMPSQEYLQRVAALALEQRSELASRFIRRHGRQGSVAALGPLERAAMQLQLDEEALDAWRQNIAVLHSRSVGTNAQT